MSSNPSLYRYIDFLGGAILDASNVTLLQTELERIGSQGLGQLYASGTLLNGVFNITGTSIVFTHFNSSYDIFGFINGQFEDLGATISIGGTQPTTGASNPLYLNWSWDIKTSVDDSSFIDGITGEPTIEAGQLSFQVSWTDTSGTSLNLSTQFGKNTSPIILATFDMSVPGTVTPTYINGVAPYAWGTPKQAGFVRLTSDSNWIANSSSFTLGQQIIDSNGNIQQVTHINVSGVTGSSAPTWNATPGFTTVDGTYTWTNMGIPARGVAVNSTDISVTNARNPITGSVYDSSVAALISSGTNSTTLPAWAPANNYSVGNQVVDSNGNIETVVSVSSSGTSGGSVTWNTSLGGTTFDFQVVWINGGTASTTKYDPTTASQGGIFTDHIIYTSLKQKLTTFLDTVNTSVANALVALTNHIGKPLGSAETHPFPTALQVGAAPLSHVGQILGLSTSHPAQVNNDHNGFVVLRNPAITAATTDYGYEITDGTNVLAGITHPGDIFSSLANLINAQGDNGVGGSATNRGTLGLMSFIAKVLAEHVNYNTHGNNNPHNLNASDVGAVTAVYVDQQVSSIIADLSSYVDARANIAVRVVRTAGAAQTVGQVISGTNPGSLQWPVTTDQITYVIINYGGTFEVAFGFGTYQGGRQVALPESANWSSSNWYGVAALAWAENFSAYDSGRGVYFKAWVDPNTRIVTSYGTTDSGPQFLFTGIASVVAVGFRVISPLPIIISAFDSTANMFDAGHVGDTVVITGRNFGSTRGSNTILFNGVAAVTYNVWSPTIISVVVPSASSGLITYHISGGASITSSFVFTIT